jgi:hypothetical protein
MKKVLIILALSLMALTAKAQVYVGGGISFQGTAANGQSSAVFTIAPEVGYNLDDNMAVGLSIGMGFADGITVFSLDPYFRYYFLDWGPLRFFADGNFNFTNTSVKNVENGSHSTWGLGVKPGIAVPVNEKWSIVGHVASLGYYDGTFGFNLNSMAGIGVYYEF